MPVNEEVQLLQNAKMGDQDAQGRLYREFFAYSKQIRNLLVRELPSEEDREDTLHDAFISLIRSGSEFRGDSRLNTFVYRIVQVTILQRRRFEKARRMDRMVRLTQDFDGEEKQMEMSFTDYQFQQVESVAVADRLYQMLPEPLRTAFRLRVSEEMSYEEIAQATKSPVNTVATRIFKARGILARFFGAPRSVAGVAAVAAIGAEEAQLPEIVRKKTDSGGN